MAEATPTRPAVAQQQQQPVVDPNTTHAQGDPYGGPVETDATAGDASLRKNYEKLRDQTAEANAAGNAAEVARLKPLKQEAFTKWNDSKTKAEEQARERAQREHRRA